jgi:hypothetical protein
MVNGYTLFASDGKRHHQQKAKKTEPTDRTLRTLLTHGITQSHRRTVGLSFSVAWTAGIPYELNRTNLPVSPILSELLHFPTFKSIIHHPPPFSKIHHCPHHVTAFFQQTKLPKNR